MLKRREAIKEIVAFLAVGGASYFLNLLVLAYCVEWLGMHYAAAMIISFVVVVSIAHSLNRHLVFKSQASYIRELGKYNLVIVGQFILGLGLMAAFVELGHLSYLIANAVAAALLAAGSYLLHKTWTFARRGAADE